MEEHYTKGNKNMWEGRIDSLTDRSSFRLHQVVQCIDIQNIIKENLDIKIKNFCLLGFCCDEGVKRNKGRIGAKQGPAAIRKAIANLPLHFTNQVNLFYGGDISCNDQYMDQAQKSLSEVIEKILALEMHPIIMGGGHEIAFGSFNGNFRFLQKENPKPKLGILNFDAHFDLRPYDQGTSSGTMFTQIADQLKEQEIDFNYFCIGIQAMGNTKHLFDKANTLGVEYIFANQLVPSLEKENIHKLRKFIGALDHLYITICSDVFHLSAAPGVSAPAPLGIMPKEMLPYLHIAAKSEKSIGLDIAEVNPSLDIDNHTSKLAAGLIYEYMLSIVG